MNKMLSCEFIIDTGNVELRYADGSMISIDRTEVEAELAMSINARSKLDCTMRSSGSTARGRCCLCCAYFRPKCVFLPKCVRLVQALAG